MTKLMLPLAGGLLIFASHTALAVGAIGDPAAGKKKAAEVCVACHGTDGKGTTPQYPNLAGQHANYIVKALEDYASGARNNPIMKGFATSLTKSDRENLGAWYSKQPSRVHTVKYD